MKYKYLYILLVMCLLLPACAHEQKIKYNIPVSLTKEAKEKLLATLDQGKELYRANCTECHGVFTKGKDKIPNFTNEQIDNYSARFIRHDPKNHAAAIKMSPQQLNEIMTFLKYKMPGNPDSVHTSRPNRRHV